MVSVLQVWWVECSGAGDGELGLDGRLEPFTQLGKG
jgi:hypothetical protein